MSKGQLRRSANTGSLPPDWSVVLKDQLSASYFQKLQGFVENERRQDQVFPPAEDVFAAFHATPFERVRVLLLGQDPYHDDGQAHGLCFSVRPGVKPPPSLANIFKELHNDIGCPLPEHGCLNAWARQGVLLLNTVLTVRAHQAHSHRRRGWETFTDAVIRAVNAKPNPVVFLLWGRPAQQKAKLIDASRHTIIESAHPSPLSASRGFFGSRPFSAANRALKQAGSEEIDWNLS
jgi:uracil-DNA glycosylase